MMSAADVGDAENGMTQSTGPKKFGDFFLIKKIATGGMAEIHLARTRTTQGPEKYVALKMIHPRYMEDGNFHRMIVEEAKIAILLNHKNIGQVFDLGCVESRYFLVMEFVDGYDLSRMHEVCQDKAVEIPIDVCAFVGREVCAALHYAHNHRDRQGRPLDLIHRDISPQNILLSFGGEVKIIDFGIAKVSTQLQQTQVGVIKGKFYYMSPEQAGAHDVDQRSDLFSLGICLWETLCGRSLFRREGGPTNPLAILHEIRTLRIPRVREFRPDCPRELDEIIARALSRDLSQRFKSAQAMQGAFNRFLMSQRPPFDRSRLARFMVEVYEKEETSKETDRISTSMAQLMQRADFLPSQHSVVYELGQPLPAGQPSRPSNVPVAPSADATHILSGTPPPLPIPSRQPIAAPVVGTSRTSASRSRPRNGVVMAGEIPTNQELPKLTGSDLAMSETVFLRRDDVEEMQRAGQAPKVLDESGENLPVVSDADPNSRTQSLSGDQIRAAHARYAVELESSFGPQSGAMPVSDPRDEPTRADSRQIPPDIPLSQHPLFRLLVIGVLVLCVLTATLALLLVRRARNRERLANERPGIMRPATPPPADSGTP